MARLRVAFSALTRIRAVLDARGLANETQCRDIRRPPCARGRGHGPTSQSSISNLLPVVGARDRASCWGFGWDYTPLTIGYFIGRICSGAAGISAYERLGPGQRPYDCRGVARSKGLDAAMRIIAFRSRGITGLSGLVGLAQLGVAIFLRHLLRRVCSIPGTREHRCSRAFWKALVAIGISGPRLYLPCLCPFRGGGIFTKGIARCRGRSCRPRSKAGIPRGRVSPQSSASLRQRGR